MENTQKVGIAGVGAIGSAVGRALTKGIDGLDWIAASEIAPKDEFDIPYVSFDELIDRCDIIIEALPPEVVPELAIKVIEAQKTLVLISSCALLIYPEILNTHNSIPRAKRGRIIVPSGAITGIDGVKALQKMGIQKCTITSTKNPKGFIGGAYVEEMGIDLTQLEGRTKIFEGNAREAAKVLPANINVAATLSLAGLGPEKTAVEIYTDPKAVGNHHQIEVVSEFSTFRMEVQNTPDPANPKTSMVAAQSIIAYLEDINNALVVL